MASNEPSGNRNTWIAALLSALAGAALVVRALVGAKPKPAGGPAPAAPAPVQPSPSLALPPPHAHRADAASNLDLEHGPGIPETPLRPGWNRPRPAELPRPTYWPAVFALGLMFLAWGVVTSLIVSVVGLALFALGLAGWIGELRHDAGH